MKFYNLTTGLEGVRLLDCPRFVRIQSSHIESKKWDRILGQLSDELLFYLAIGYRCYIVEGTNKSSNSKVIRIAIPMICYILNRIWLKKVIMIPRTDIKYLDKVYKELPEVVRTKLKYFRKFLLTDKIRLYGVAVRAYHDGEYEWYRKKVWSESGCFKKPVDVKSEKIS